LGFRLLDFFLLGTRFPKYTEFPALLLALVDDHLDGVEEEGVEEEGEEGCKSLREESDALHSHGYTAKPWLHLKFVMC